MQHCLNRLAHSARLSPPPFCLPPPPPPPTRGPPDLLWRAPPTQMASSSSSSRSAGEAAEYWRRNLQSASPIPYREAPLEYTPAVNCKCGVKAAQFISWSDLNPGMRFQKCARARVSSNFRSICLGYLSSIHFMLDPLSQWVLDFVFLRRRVVVSFTTGCMSQP